MQNIGFIILNIYALFILFILCVIFFKKERLHQAEDETYGDLLKRSLVTIAVGVILGILSVIPEINPIILKLTNKIYLFGMTMVISTFTSYTALIATKENNILRNKTIFKYINIFTLILIRRSNSLCRIICIHNIHNIWNVFYDNNSINIS